MSAPAKQKMLSPDRRTSPRRRPQTSPFIRPLPPPVISPIRTSPRRRPLTVETTQKPGPKSKQTSSSPRRRLNFDEQPMAASTPSFRVKRPNKRVLLAAQKQTYTIQSVQTPSSSSNKRPADQSHIEDVPPPKKRATTAKKTPSNEIASSAVPSGSTRKSPRKQQQTRQIPHKNANVALEEEDGDPDDKNWVIYTIYHPSNVQQEIRNGGESIEQVSKTIFTLAKKSGFLPESIDRSHPLLFSISQKEYEINGQLILSGSRYKLSREKKEFPAVKLTFKGSIANFLNFYAEPNNILLIFGRMLDSRSVLDILPEKKNPRIFCFVLRETQIHQKAEIKSFTTIDCPIYSDPLCKDYPHFVTTPSTPLISQVLITYPKFTMDGETFIPWMQEEQVLGQQQEMLEQNIVENDDDDEDFVQLEIRSNNQENEQRPSRTALIASGRRGNEQVNTLPAKTSSRRLTSGQLDSSGVVFERARLYNPPLSSSPRRPVIDINSVGQSEAVQMVLDNHYFVDGQNRPKLEKVRSSSYSYENFRELKDQLERLTIDQFQNGQVPDATLLEEKFIYGLVVSLCSPGQTEKNYYRVYISDETLENIPLRLCTSKADNIKGPELKIGDVVRVHRARVQMEFDAVKDGQGMAISTAPHRNYTVFRRDPSDRKKIIYDSAANTVRHSDSDIRIIQKLFELAKDKIHEDIPNDLFDSQWDGNTDVTPSIRTIVVPLNNNVTTSNPVNPRPHLGITQFYDPPSLPPSPSISPHCSSSEDMEVDDEEEQSSEVNINQRRTSPRFHVPPFGFQN